MLEHAETVIAAVSGGCDSLCMLYVLHELRAVRRFDLRAAHINHAFRAEADDDARFVAEVCKKLGVRSYTTKVDVARYAKQNGISFETAGREVRYAFFDELMADLPHSVTATAHNANDSAESFMMHLLRGSGLGGLTGISAVRGRIIRPLIERPREEIEAYRKARRLTPREDSTNAEDVYTRNDVRHHVMPPIAERGGIEAIARAARLLAEDEAFLRQYTARLAETYLSDGGGGELTLNAAEFNALPTAVRRRLLRYALNGAEREIGAAHIESVLSLAQRNRGGKYLRLPGGVTVSLKSGKLIIKRNLA
jgi:tRNA(Ile)-lysidine synthase